MGRPLRCLGAVLVLACLVATLAAAQAPRVGDSESQPLRLDEAGGLPTGASPGAYLLRAMLSLALVVCLIYAVYYGLRWWRGGALRVAKGRGIVVLDHARLDGDKSVYVVALGGKVVVLGASGSQLQMLCELGEEEAAAFRQLWAQETSGQKAAQQGP